MRFGLMSLVVATIGCSAAESHDMQTARQQWLDGNHATYRYTLVRDCFCADSGRPLRVEVLGDTVSAAYLDGAHEQALYPAPSIEDVFAQIEAAKEVEATYDSDLGYPISVTFNRSQIPSDGGYTYELSDFESN